MGTEKDCRRPLVASRRLRPPRPAPRGAWIIGLIACLLAAPCASAQVALARAVLVRGTLQVRGVPHLPVNAVPALYGEYRLDSGPVRVWVVREDLFLTPEWGEFPFQSPRGTRIRAFSRTFQSGESRGAAFALRDSAYWILAEVSAAAGNPLPFLESLAARLAYFASQTKSPGDLSLPAVLEFTAP